ncbi:MAG: ParB N-terminal domain-containing protein [Deltaproteobacteria bacterium]|nr:ParB N-terminal domain-containing protein [Deltaproteobacteria bacterium]
MHNISDMESHLVDLKDIDDLPGPFCMSFEFNLEPLIQSIQKIGLINSPVIVRNKKGRVDIVVGYRRIMAMKVLHMDKVPCRDLSHAGLTPLELLCLNLRDNLATRQFNDVEKAMVLARLTPLVTVQEILDTYMALLDLPSHEQTLFSFLSLEKDLEEEIKAYVAQGHISVSGAQSLLELKSDDRRHIFKLIRTLRLNMNQQRKLIDLLDDISYIENITISEVLEQEPIEAICLDRQMSNPQRAKALLAFLRSMRLPSVVRAERIFRKQVSKLNFPSGIRLTAPPFFEGSHYRLEVSFKKGKELKEKIERLSQIKGVEDLDDPWDQDT